MTPKGKSTEVDAYIFIKENLKAQGWDIRNPERVASGQVYTQNECLANPEIKKLFGQKHPENIVKVTEKVLWVIEAKKSHGELKLALSEAEERAKILSTSKQFQAKFISGIAGNSLDTFIVRTYFFDGHSFLPVKLNGIEATGLLSRLQLLTILDANNPNIENPKIDEKLFLSRAERINKILHLGAINPHQRAGVMAALLLSKISETGPNIEERNTMVLIGDINGRVEAVLKDQGKSEFQQYIKLLPPASKDNHFKFRKALIDTLQELDNLNIRSAMNSGDDWLGTFYEVFLKYASWAQDLGIVLTPRHLTRFVAEIMDVQINDIVYDPTCGTGGFLVAALDYVKQHGNADQVGRFKRNGVFGIEEQDGIASLAVVNMIFRGDGKNNIKEGNCFATFLAPAIDHGEPTAKYVREQSDNPPVTKVMMNPPFALEQSIDREFRFIDQALHQMQDGGILFSVLPYSAMVRGGVYLNWRKHSLLADNTLLAVITLPPDLFYPIGITAVGLFVKKGISHQEHQPVLWVRAINDGLLKSKGRRLPNPKASNDLTTIKETLRAFIHNPTNNVSNTPKFQRAVSLNMDTSMELVPEIYLEQDAPTEIEVAEVSHSLAKNTLAYLVKIDRAVIKVAPKPNQAKIHLPPHSWQAFRASDIFDLTRGDFHAIEDLEPGTYPTISRIATDCGFVGLYDKPEGAVVYPPKTITVSTVTGDAYVQPVPFIATDNIVLCAPKSKYKTLKLTSLWFISVMFNTVKWRYSYGRQCYIKKFSNTEVMLPVTESGALDENYMSSVAEETPYWPLLALVFNAHI